MCNKQCFPASTPHVGQGTASNSCGVTSVILTDQAYCDPYRKTVQIWTDSRLHVIGFCQFVACPYKVLNDRCDLFSLWPRGSCALGTNAGSKLFATLGFKLLLHLIQ